MNRLHALDAQLAVPTKPVRGLTPPALNTRVHVVRCHCQLRSKDKPLEKYIYLSQLKQADENMFYYLCLQNLTVRICCSAALPSLSRLHFPSCSYAHCNRRK